MAKKNNIYVFEYNKDLYVLDENNQLYTIDGKKVNNGTQVLYGTLLNLGVKEKLIKKADYKELAAIFKWEAKKAEMQEKILAKKIKLMIKHDVKKLEFGLLRDALKIKKAIKKEIKKEIKAAKKGC